MGRGLAWARYKLSGAWCAVLARVRVALRRQQPNLTEPVVATAAFRVDLERQLVLVSGGGSGHEPLHGGLERRVQHHKRFGDFSRTDDLACAVDIGEKRVERARALLQPALDEAPLMP